MWHILLAFQIDENSQRCGFCKAKMSEYFCATCKHFTSVDKNPFHCTKCGICSCHCRGMQPWEVKQIPGNVLYRALRRKKAFFCGIQLHSFAYIHTFNTHTSTDNKFLIHSTTIAHTIFLWRKDNNTFVHSQRLRDLLQQWEIRLSHFLCLLPLFVNMFFFPFFFVSLKVNKCTTAVRIVIDPSELPMCDCSDSENSCGPESNCLNRMLQFECNPTRCPGKEKCQNQQFQKREYVDCEPLRTLHCGWGLRCKEG